MRSGGDGFNAAGQRPRHDVGDVRNLRPEPLALLPGASSFHRAGVLGDQAREDAPTEVCFHRGPRVSRCFCEDELCKRLGGSDGRELDERPRGYPPLITTRAALTDEVIERGHVPRAVHLEQRCDDGDGDGE